MLGCFNLSMLLTLLALFLLHDFSFFFLLAILPHKLFQVFCRSRSRRSPCGVGLQGLPCDGLWSYGFFATWKRTIVLWVLVLMTEPWKFVTILLLYVGMHGLFHCFCETSAPTNQRLTCDGEKNSLNQYISATFLDPIGLGYAFQLNGCRLCSLLAIEIFMKFVMLFS